MDRRTQFLTEHNTARATNMHPSIVGGIMQKNLAHIKAREAVNYASIDTAPEERERHITIQRDTTDRM